MGSLVLVRAEMLRAGVASMSSWAPRRWLVAALAAAAAALVTGVPTGIIDTSFYTRMTPVTWWDYPFWILASVLVGLTAATYVRQDRFVAPPTSERTGRTVVGTLLSGSIACRA